MALSQQKSHALCSVDVLRDLFIQGKIDFIMKLFLQMNAVLSKEHQLIDQARKKHESALESKIDSRVRSTI